MLLGTNIEHGKAYNLRIVLETIRLHGPISRADTSRRTALTRPTISNIVRELMEHGLVLETGQQQGKRGTPSTQLEINADGAFAVGLDLDRDHLTGVLVDFRGRVRQRLHHSLDFPTPDEGLELMERVAQALIHQEGLSHEAVFGVGLGFPGPLRLDKNRPREVTVNPYNFPGWQNVPIAAKLSERLGLHVTLENNATAAALGERWYGAGRAMSDFFYVYFGMGLGGGLILNGQRYDGFGGNAGELGYLPVQLPEGATYLGHLFRPPALYEALTQGGKPVKTLHDVALLYEKGDPQVRDWLELLCDHLAPALITIEHLFDPEAIIIGGSLPETLRGALLERLRILMPPLRREGKAYPSQLLAAHVGEDAAALGLAILPIYESVSPNLNLLFKRRRARKPVKDMLNT